MLEERSRVQEWHRQKRNMLQERVADVRSSWLPQEAFDDDRAQ